MIGPLQLPWYWQSIHAVQTAFGSTSSKYAATIGSIVAFVFFVMVLYRVGRRLKDEYNADAVEAVQSLLVTTVAILVSGFLVAVWRISNEVIEALGFLSITPEQGIKALVTFIVFAGAITVTRLTKRSIKYGAGRVTITPHQREVAHHAVQIAILVPTLAFVITLWGIPVTNIFLGAGVLGIVLGFAARKTLSGILSGFVILFARPFEIGDWVNVADREGIVTDITVYNTQIRTFNEEHVQIPNDLVTENEVVNYSKTNRLRLETAVGVDYETDIAKRHASPSPRWSVSTRSPHSHRRTSSDRSSRIRRSCCGSVTGSRRRRFKRSGGHRTRWSNRSRRPSKPRRSRYRSRSVS